MRRRRLAAVLAALALLAIGLLGGAHTSAAAERRPAESVRQETPWRLPERTAAIIATVSVGGFVLVTLAIVLWRRPRG